MYSKFRKKDILIFGGGIFYAHKNRKIIYPQV